jgi:D-serine deaminase-like pyridoxal phosphate-dependent protein
MRRDAPLEKGWYVIDNADEITSPSLLVYPERIESNIRGMISIAGGADRLRPHVKTHKMAEIIRLQIDAGIYKFKCATISETEMVAGCGAKDILLAMQPVGPNIPRFFRLKQEFPDTRISCITDSEEIAFQLSDMSLSTGLETLVWMDINNGMNRTGIQPGEEAVTLARKIASMPGLKLEGMHVYDGHIHERDIVRRKKVCDDSFGPVTWMLERLSGEGIPGLKVIAGGSTTFSAHALRQDVECSPGTPVLWDFNYSSSFPDMNFLHAAVLFTRIISKPAQGLVSLDLGYKAVAAEIPQPRVAFPGLRNYSIISQSEEHLVIETNEADDLKIGTHVYGIPWHICPTVDRYDSVFVVRDRMVTEHWNVNARKRKLTI